MSDKTTNIIAGTIAAIIIGLALYGLGVIVGQIVEATCS